QERNIVAVPCEEVEREIDQPAHALPRLDTAEIEAALLGADLRVDAVEHGRIEPLFIAEIVIEEPHIRAALRRDIFHARAGEAIAAEFGNGCLENGLARARGVALAAL